MTKDANPREIDLTLGEKTFRIVPDFQTITRIEDALGQPSRALGLKCYAAVQSQAWRTANGVTQEISVSEMAAIVFCTLRDKEGAPKSVGDAGDILMDYGYDDLLIPMANFLSRAKRGHKDHEREAKMAAERAEREKEAGNEPSADPPQT